MRRLLSVSNMRDSDAATIKAGTPGGVLMYRAAVGIKLALEQYGLYEDANVLIVCGSGNNAGDGYALASILNKENVDVALCLASDKFSEDGRFYYDICVENNIVMFKASQLDIVDMADKCCSESKLLIVDCLLGTGFSGTPREPIYSIISDINAARRNHPQDVTVVSVDINSGLNGDNGLANMCVESDITVSIGDLKPGLFLGDAKDVVGEIINVDIGIEPIDTPYYLIDEIDVAKCIPARKNNSNKGTYGYIALIGGSMRYSGAASLATNASNMTAGALSGKELMARPLIDNGDAAMRQGAGVVLLGAPKSMCPLIIPRIMESTIFPLSDKDGEVIFVKEEIDELMDRVRVIAFGMGIGNTSESAKVLEYLVANYTGVLIIDADGLNALSKKLSDNPRILLESKCKKIVLTPHLKEFSRLSGCEMSDIRENPIALAKNFAKDNNVVVLLKGPSTIVTDGEEVLVSDRGCAGMATAGSGDVLSGILAAICGYNTKKNGKDEDILLSVAAGAYINGLAGEMAQEEYGSVSMVASDTVNCIYKAIREVTNI